MLIGNTIFESAGLHSTVKEDTGFQEDPLRFTIFLRSALTFTVTVCLNSRGTATLASL